MPWAINGTISQDKLPVGVEITQEQYLEALAGVDVGKIISTDGGFQMKEPPPPEMPDLPEPPTFYIISKMTPWMRMTDDEAVIMRQAMEAAPVRLQEIYKAAPYLQSNDALWPTLYGMLASNLSLARADELLAFETTP